ncbi:hypothetical protein BDZ97DRAFT_1883661 [Flammula alnicola]|nr:hypothetical protein BDZ97DRAFT_1883661 [Flammula alnicola]
MKDADPQSEKAKEMVQVDVEGGLRRCGGQGDVLSGSVGVFKNMRFWHLEQRWKLLA